MKIVVADPVVAETIRDRGGRLFVWTDPHRCCGGGITFLKTSAEPAGRHDFQRVEGVDGFDLWIDTGGRELPDELQLELKGHRTKRVEAYWNGCAFKP
jgi:hypothetical protein